MFPLDKRLVEYLLEPEPLSVEELFAVEAKKLGSPKQFKAFVCRCQELADKGSTLEIVGVEMWYGRLEVVYREDPPGTGQPIDRIGARGHVEHLVRPRGKERLGRPK